jgi:hypothetical protein
MTRARGVGSWVAARLRAAGAWLRARILALVATLRDGASRESRRRRALWLAVAALLVVGPLAFNLAREPDHEASVLLFARDIGPYRAPTDMRLYRAALRDPILRFEMERNADATDDDYTGVTIARTARLKVLRLTVAADAPARSRRLVNVLAPQIAGFLHRRLIARRPRDIRMVQRRITTARGRARRNLRRALRELERIGPVPATPVLPGARAEVPELERWADRLVDDLPGDFQPRPHPAWAALAGLLVAATLWGISLVLVPPRRADSDAAAPAA